MSFEGIYTAIITPFCDGKLDCKALKKLIDLQVEAGIDGIVPVGTTGESPTLTHEEHIEVIARSVEYAAGRLKVVAGTGANATHEAIKLTLEAEALGVDGSLQVCPYYNKPSQQGLYAHFKTIADATKLPIMLYSIPGRSVIEISVDTIAALARDCANICSLKEAGGNVDRINQLKQALPQDFTLLSGDDQLTLPFMACGAKGLVSVSSNLIPKQMRELVHSCLAGDFVKAQALQLKWYPLMQGLMGLDTNPVPIKSALALLDLVDAEFRLPLVGLNDEKTAALRALLSKFQLLA